MAYVAQLEVDLATLLRAVEEWYELASERSRVEPIAEAATPRSRCSPRSNATFGTEF